MGMRVEATRRKEKGPDGRQEDERGKRTTPQKDGIPHQYIVGHATRWSQRSDHCVIECVVERIE